MADTKLTALPAIAQGNVDNSALLYIVDVTGGNVSSQITKPNLFAGTKVTQLPLTLPSAPTGGASAFFAAMKVSSGTVAFATSAQTGDFSTTWIDQATLTNPSSGTITNAASLVIVGAPIASTNVTITNNYSFWVKAGTTLLQATTMAGTLTMSSADITLAGNHLITNLMSMADGTFGTFGAFGITRSGTNNNTNLVLYPTGSNVISSLILFRTSDTTTNYEYIRLGSDIIVSNEFGMNISKNGSGTLRPLNIYMFGTKLLSFDTANTITSYVNLIMSGASIVPPAYTTSGVAAWFADAGGNSFAIASGSTATPFGNSNNFAGWFIIENTSDGAMAMVATSGGNVSITNLIGTEFANTPTPSASQTGVYLASSIITIKNGLAVSKSYNIIALRSNIGN